MNRGNAEEKDSSLLLAIIPSLRMGGAERVMVWLCNSLAESRGWEVFLLTFTKESEEPAYHVSSSVSLIRADVPGSAGDPRQFTLLLKRIRCIGSWIDRVKPDVVLSFLDTNNLVVLLAALGKRVRVVISERIDPSMQTISPLAQHLRQWLYPRADCLVVQTNRVRDWFEGTRIPNVTVIPNAIDPGPFSSHDSGGKRVHRIVAVGRLSEQKGFHHLINCFSRLADEFSTWEVVIYGEGELRESLQERIDESGLGDRIHLPGNVTDIERRLMEGALFAFPSLYEGFPNAVAEAMTAGLPVVAFQGVSGLEELVVDSETGFLVSYRSEDDFAAALGKLMINPELRKQMGERAKARVRDACNPERILAEWEAALLP